MAQAAATGQLVNTLALTQPSLVSKLLPIPSSSRDHLHRLIVQWIVNTNRAFTDAEEPDLCVIFEYLIHLLHYGEPM